MKSVLMFYILVIKGSKFGFLSFSTTTIRFGQAFSEVVAPIYYQHNATQYVDSTYGTIQQQISKLLQSITEFGEQMKIKLFCEGKHFN